MSPEGAHLMETAGTSRWRGHAEWLAVCGIAAAARAWYPNPTTHTDEHFHLLAARSLRELGTLRITPEAIPYDRAWAYTWGVAACQSLFGEGLFASRLPSLVSGVLLVGAVFAFLRRHASRGAAWLGAMLLCFSLPALQLSAMARFYMPHALFTWIAGWAFYELAAGGKLRCPRWWIILAVATVAAFHLQASTAIPAGAALLWAAAFGVWTLRRGGVGWRTVAVVCGLGLAGVFALWFGGFFAFLWERYTAPRVWAEKTEGDWAFYHRMMMEYRPVLYVLLPAAALAAARARPRPAVWAASIFAIAWIAHAVLSPRAERYILYALPFFYTLWGIAGATWGTQLWRMARTLLNRANMPAVLTSIGAPAAALVALTAPLLLAPDYRTAAQLMCGNTTVGPYREADWRGAAETLLPVLTPQMLLVGSAGPDVMYYFGRCDVVLSVSGVLRREEFSLHERLGRPAISTPESVAQLMREHPAGLMVIRHGHWRNRLHVPHETCDYIETHAERLPDPARGIRAYRWPATPPATP